VQHALGEASHYNTLPAEFKGQYFTVQQRELTPVCVVQPESAEQVSQIVNILKEQECSFTIRSGGHGNHAGTSSIHNGLVVDLSKLNSVEISDDESTAFIGSGNRWRDVYPVLEKRGLLTIGGRAGAVGVGGFTLGGNVASRRPSHSY
jgi:FAD/FMN-containing dehydrogenase